MTTPDDKSQQQDVESKIKREIVSIFRILLEQLWNRLQHTIGKTATAAIFRSALRETGETYPFLEMVDVSAEGVVLDEAADEFLRVDRKRLKAGLLALLDNTMALIVDLTGSILIRKVEPIVEEFKQQVKDDAGSEAK